MADEKVHTAWVANQMQELLTKDTSKVSTVRSCVSPSPVVPRYGIAPAHLDHKQMLDIHVFVLHAGAICLLDEDNPVSRPIAGRVIRLGDRMDVAYCAMNAESAIRSELGQRKGRMAISCMSCPALCWCFSADCCV